MMTVLGYVQYFFFKALRDTTHLKTMNLLKMCSLMHLDIHASSNTWDSVITVKIVSVVPHS